MTVRVSMHVAMVTRRRTISSTTLSSKHPVYYSNSIRMTDLRLMTERVMSCLILINIPLQWTITVYQKRAQRQIFGVSGVAVNYCKSVLMCVHPPLLCSHPNPGVSSLTLLLLLFLLFSSSNPAAQNLQRGLNIKSRWEPEQLVWIETCMLCCIWALLMPIHIMSLFSLPDPIGCQMINPYII